MKSSQTALLPLLKRYFGFASFRPLQEEIIRDALAGKDVFALLPTGGGKSLCYQLPALIRPGLTIVISPLISLMKDQVDALQTSGIDATYLNSSLSPTESRRRLSGLHNKKMVQYAESSGCRRSLLLDYFGEQYLKANCDGCDNCLLPREKYDGTVDAQKFLSCVYRIHQKSGFNVGLQYVVVVLTGGDTEKIRRWNHKELSTYGIGKDRSREEWMAIGRELMRLRLLRQQDNSGFSIVELTPEGMEALKQRSSIKLTKPAMVEEAVKVRDDEQRYDRALFGQLRELRKRLADKRDVPAFVIFSDTALRQMAREYPKTGEEFTRISGVGQKKLKDFGKIFIDEITNYLKNNPGASARQTSAQAAPVKSKWMNQTTQESLRLFRAGKSVEEIAAIRNLKSSTIYTHLLNAANAGEKIDLHRFISPEALNEIRAAFKKIGYGNLTGVFELLGKRFDYGVLRIVRALE